MASTMTEQAVSATSGPAWMQDEPDGRGATPPEGAHRRVVEQYRENYERARREADAAEELRSFDVLVRRRLAEYFEVNFDPRKYDVVEDDIRTVVSRRLRGL
jgi:hypothetical protein